MTADTGTAGAERPGPASADGQSIEWMRRANCLGCNPVRFFPTVGEAAAEAKAVCAGCTVRVECFEYAAANNERFGVWGGTTEKERRLLRRWAR